MPKLNDVLKANNVKIVARQEMGNGEWLLFIAHPGSVSFPTPLYPCYTLYAESRNPTDISDDIAQAINRRFRPPLLPGFEEPIE